MKSASYEYAYKHKRERYQTFIRHFILEQDKSSDIEQQPPFGDRKKSNIQPENRVKSSNEYSIAFWDDKVSCLVF